MNWISNVVRPKIKDLFSKRDTPDNLWVTCPETQQMVYVKDLEANQFVIPQSGFHMKIPAKRRLEFFFDGGKCDVLEQPEVPTDPLKFKDQKKYTDRLKAARAKTDMKDAVLVGHGTIDGTPVTAGVQDFAFLGGSLGMAAGEMIIKGMLHAVEKKTGFVLFVASGGARMQEGILSLMQMPRTTVAIQKLKDNGLPYIVVLTNPTTGGVTASYAMLGDVHIAEPGALIGFAGPRVIETTIREKLPEGFQRAEYLLEHGMVDMVLPRKDHKRTIGQLLRMMQNLPEPRLALPDRVDIDAIPQAQTNDTSQDTPEADEQNEPVEKPSETQ